MYAKAGEAPEPLIWGINSSHGYLFVTAFEVNRLQKPPGRLGGEADAHEKQFIPFQSSVVPQREKVLIVYMLRDSVMSQQNPQQKRPRQGNERQASNLLFFFWRRAKRTSQSVLLFFLHSDVSSICEPAFLLPVSFSPCLSLCMRSFISVRHISSKFQDTAFADNNKRPLKVVSFPQIVLLRRCAVSFARAESDCYTPSEMPSSSL